MNDVRSYWVELRGQLEESEIYPTSPLQITVQQVPVGPAGQPANTQLVVYTDQAGLIGLLRYLHGKGFVIEAVGLARS